MAEWRAMAVGAGGERDFVSKSADTRLAQLLGCGSPGTRETRRARHRAKRELGLASINAAHTGAVCAVQRTDGALRLNVHFHVVALDGVYVRNAETGALVFEELGTPTHAEVLDVARRTAALRFRGTTCGAGHYPPDSFCSASSS